VEPATLTQSVTSIVPTLNEAENFELLTRRIMASGIDPLEIIFVDDGSTDGTGERVRKLAGEFPVSLVLRENPTLGLSGAVVAGARVAAGDLLVVMDADLSHPPSRIPDLVRPVQVGDCEMVIGSRYVRGGTTPDWPLWRKIMSRAASALAYPLTRVHDSMCGFFAIPRPLLLELAPAATGFKIAFEIIVHGGPGLRVREIPIAFRDRARGASKMTFRIAAVFFIRWLAAIVRRKPARAATAATQSRVR
jgi:dolichol-phosphate mannosyltransferase